MIGAGIVAAGASLLGAATAAAANLFTNVAMNRKVPKFLEKAGKKKQLQGYEMTSDFMTQLGESGKLLKSQPHEIVQITGYDGVKLVGHWFPGKNPKRVMVAMHGWRSSWDRDFGYCRSFYEENDCSVLYAEQRGQGLSEGEYIGFGLTERYDCRDWAKWVARRVGPDMPIFLTGISMGATTVLMAAGLKLPENVRGVIADCGFTSPEAIWQHVAKNNLKIPYGVHGAFAKWMYKRRTKQASDSYSTLDAMAHCKVPVLFAHGEDDHFVPVEMTYQNYQACVAPKRMLIVPGADHGMSYPKQQQEYEQAVREFWEEFG